ncbi:class I SAM-dependent methyltransferase [Candidatus Nitrosocosmicus hydrocola]|uniref:class I SAM-dependent methyltransferase n=1 Tax=Candidatus Nitrosocosmicus hydrocola TaxID=1826872 RepID=UPI000A44665F|nr:methyltransferase domain-containing protein [Candidatus Nitrosocosmicus hydrocola]
MESTNSENKENESTNKGLQSNVKSNNVWALGNYQSISTMLPPISAHLIKLICIEKGESVLDIACGNGNTAISARRQGADVTGIDITPELLSLAVEEEKIANVSGIKWKEGDAQNLPFEDESFDVVLSTFGHMFAPDPELTAKEMIRVTKKGGRIGFATWPPELAIGSIFRTNAKHLPKNPNAPPSPILWGVTETIEKRLSGISQFYFERGIVTFPILSRNHFWEHMSKKYGPLIKSIEVLENLNDPNEPESLRIDFLKAIDPYFVDNGIRLGYLLTIATK